VGYLLAVPKARVRLATEDTERTKDGKSDCGFRGSDFPLRFGRKRPPRHRKTVCGTRLTIYGYKLERPVGLPDGKEIPFAIDPGEDTARLSDG
jgi:hypothetical protein